MRTPSFLPADNDDCLRLDVHLAEGRIGQDINGFTHTQVAHDVLNDYQRHLQFLSQVDKTLDLANTPGVRANRGHLLWLARATTYRFLGNGNGVITEMH
ncbi:hypothetical protein FBG13_06910 [Cobetia marina]|nr:hypothetical protein FBG13_06910 [Cobetia marina]